MTRRAAALGDALAGWLPAGATIDLPGLAPSLGAEATVLVGEPRPFRDDERMAIRASARVVVEHVPSGLRGLVEVDAPLAVALGGLALGRRVDRESPPPRELDRAEQGVLLYLVARALWRGPDGPATPLRVVGLLPSSARDGAPRELAITLPLTLRGPGVSGPAWLHLPEGVERRLLEELAARRAPDAPLGLLEGLFFALHVVVGRTLLAAGELAAAGSGDAVLVDEVFARPVEDAWQGEVRLRLPWGPPRWAGRLREDGSLTVERQIAAEGGTMADEEDAPRAKAREEILAELPLELSVELGRLALTAQQILELRPGQTLLLGRRPGDPVELRAGAKLVARGDLVDVEGELGVRLGEVLPGESS